MAWWRAGRLVGGLLLSGCSGESTLQHATGAGSHPAASGETDAGSSTPLPNGGWIHQLAEVGNGTAFAVGVDATDNVLVLLGREDQAAMPEPPTLLKLDPTGRIRWRVPISQPSPRSLAVHPSGATVIASSSENPGTSNDISVTRYDPDGHEQWTTTFGSSGYDGVIAVNVGRDGQSFVLWLSTTSVGEMKLTLTDLDQDGEAHSTAEIPGVESFLVATVDAGGNVLAVGSDDDYSVSKYDAGGYEQWKVPGGSRATAIDGDEAGNVLVVGLSKTTTSLLSKLDTEGRAIFSTEFGDDREFTALVAGDSLGRAFTVGTVTDDMGATFRILARRFDEAGQASGTSSLASDQRDYAQAFAVDSRSALLVVGMTEGTFPGQMHLGGHDAFIARLVP